MQVDCQVESNPVPVQTTTALHTLYMEFTCFIVESINMHEHDGIYLVVQQGIYHV